MVIQDRRIYSCLDANKINQGYFKIKKEMEVFSIERRFLPYFSLRFVITLALMIAISLFIKVKNQQEE
jgi:hypothetical protein